MRTEGTQLRVAALILCGIAGGLLLVGAAGQDAKAPAAKKGATAKKAAPAKKMAPAFTLKDADGKTVNLSDYKGKVVLVNFWATWCGPCKIEIPWFVDFETRYKSKGFAVLGIAMDDEGWEVVKPYLAKTKINYRILGGNEKLAEAWGGVESLPTTFIVAKDGSIYKQHVGLVSKDDYEKDIRLLLDGTRGGIVTAGTNQP